MNVNTPLDLSDRETVGKLKRQAVSDALDALDELWPDNMPDDGNLERFADEKTKEFLQRSFSIPRHVFTAPPDSPWRRYYDQVGNVYYWTFLDKFAESVANRVIATYRMPPRTTPLLASNGRHAHARRQQRREGTG